MNVVTASDAHQNARVILEESAEQLDEEQWEGIVRHVFPVLDEELRRLGLEYRQLRDAG
jgi:hypothetical protein